MEEQSSTANIFSQSNEKPQEKESPQLDTFSADTKMKQDKEFEDIDVINLKNISQVYKSRKSDFVLFDNFNMDIKDFSTHGQFVSILGASGCGKSTILRYISGLQQPTSGDVLIYGKKKKEKDTIPMVFQQYSSFPWKSVIDNVALPLRMRGVSKEESYEKANTMLKAVGLEEHANKWAKYPLLSGGQLQRVAIARNLIASPQILLMDEPFGALDIATRASMQQTLLSIYNSSVLDPTVIFVTHDINEAVLLSNRVYILSANPGNVHQIVDIDLPQQRDISMKKSPLLNEYVTHIDNIMTKLSKNVK